MLGFCSNELKSFVRLCGNEIDSAEFPVDFDGCISVVRNLFIGFICKPCRKRVSLFSRCSQAGLVDFDENLFSSDIVSARCALFNSLSFAFTSFFLQFRFFHDSIPVSRNDFPLDLSPHRHRFQFHKLTYGVQYAYHAQQH